MTRVWFSWVLRITCLAACLVLQGVWLSQPYPISAKVLQATLLAIAVVRPANGLLVLAGLGPLAYNIATLLSVSTRDPHILEQMVVAVVTGALVHGRSTDAPSRTAIPATIAAVVAVASAASLMPARVLMATDTDLTIWQHVVGLWRDGFGPVWFPATSAIYVAESMALLWSAERIVRRDRAMAAKVVGFLLLGYTAAGMLNMYRVTAAAIRGGDFLHAAPGLFLNTRYNMFYDRNAAASMFALVLLAGLALWGRQVWRAAGVVALVVGMFAALWLSGSRIAVAAALVTLAGALALRAVRPGRRVVWALFCVIATVAVMSALYTRLYPAGRSDVVSFSVLGRLQMAQVALRLARSAPVVGVGIGTFAEHAPAFGSPFGPENAHNNLLQILAEEGAIGLSAAIALLAIVVVAAVRDESPDHLAVRYWLVAGLTAFAITAMTGHPLLVPEVALPFWMTVGVLGGLTPPPPASNRATWIALAVCLALGASIPVRATRLLARADLEYHGVSLSGWHSGANNERYREGGAAFALFLPADRTSIVPLRRTAAAPDPLKIEILHGGLQIASATLTGTDWQRVELHLANSGRLFERVDFRVLEPTPAKHQPYVQIGKSETR